MSIDMSQFYEVFFEEASELLSEMETLLLKLDLSTPDVEELNAIFRAAHSIKGGAGTFGFTDMTEVTHVLETLLDRLRKGELAPTSEMVDAFLQAGDVLQGQLAGHRGDGGADPAAVADVCSKLNMLASGKSGSEGTVPARPAAAVPAAESAPAESTKAVSPSPTAQQSAFRIEFSVSGGIDSNRAVLHNLRNAMTACGTLEELTTPSEDANPAVFVWRVATSSSEEDVWEAFAFLIDPSTLDIKSETLSAAQTQEPVATPVGTTEDEQGYGFFEPVAGASPESRGNDSSRSGKSPADTKSSDGDDAYYRTLYESVVPPEQGKADQQLQTQPGAEAVSVRAVSPPQVQQSSATQAASNSPSQTADDPKIDRAFGRRASDQPGAVNPASGRRENDKATSAASGETTSIRVSVEKVDQLINMVGELVITQAMLAQTVNEAEELDHEKLTNGMALLERNTRDLQESVMSIRMMPISFVFSRFPRVVRDLAGKLGKKVDLKTEGEGTELDKGLIEKIADPLTHLVRNSIDHGVERPDVRIAAGKSPVGKITLRAFHHGGSIVIEVVDDGAGLDRDRILAKAKERGLPVSDSMSDQEVWMLIFEAGFSTAQVVTDVSGRGVGMDVVRRNLQALGGTIEIDSALGAGTRMSIRLPLTLAILDGLSVRVGKQTYIVPLTYIVESLQPNVADVKTVAGGDAVIHVRGEYLPVVYAHEVFHEARNDSDIRNGIIVILESDGVKKALFVDELLGQYQVVIKSLESNYRKVHGISGATIMGDGRVALILDVGAVVRGKRAEFKVAA